MSKPILWVVIPCYNEEKVFHVTLPMFRAELDLLIEREMISDQSRLLYVNDGSTDGTWQLIRQASVEDEHVIGISQSRNRGHQSALLAGLMEARGMCDAAISIDCDGQDDIGAMTEMVEKYLDGAEIVYGVRSSRESDSFFKRSSARAFYKVMNRFGTEVIYDHADYRLLSSRVLEELADYGEVNLFLRGLIPLVGFESAVVTYERHERLAGESHYPLKKMIALAKDGITNLSTIPLALISKIGIFVCFIGLVGIIWAIITAVQGRAVAGWASIVCITCFLGGIQLLSLGVIGEYIGKMYLETKHRPRYIISERTWVENERHYKG